MFGETLLLSFLSFLPSFALFLIPVASFLNLCLVFSSPPPPSLFSPHKCVHHPNSLTTFALALLLNFLCRQRASRGRIKRRTCAILTKGADAPESCSNVNYSNKKEKKNPLKSTPPPSPPPPRTCRSALNQVKPQVKPWLQSLQSYSFKVQQCFFDA